MTACDPQSVALPPPSSSTSTSVRSSLASHTQQRSPRMCLIVIFSRGSGYWANFSLGTHKAAWRIASGDAS